MSDLILRLSFVVLLIVLYYVGSVGAIWLKNYTIVDLDLKFFLPVLSLVFFERYMRMFAEWTVDIRIIDCRLTTWDLSLDVRVAHFGSGVSELRIAEVSGVEDTNVEVHWRADEQEIITNVPENFTALLSPTNPCIYFTIRYLFRDTLQGVGSLWLIGRYFNVFRPLIIFRIGERTCYKRFFLIRRIRRRQADAGN